MLYCNAVCVAVARAPVRSMKARRMLTTIRIPKRQLFECAFTLPSRKTSAKKTQGNPNRGKRNATKGKKRSRPYLDPETNPPLPWFGPNGE